MLGLVCSNIYLARLLHVILMTRLLPLAWSAPAPSGTRQSPSSQQSSPVNVPTNGDSLAAAWIYLSDNTKYDTIPAIWHSIDFSTVDTLMIAPVGIQADGKFGLFQSDEKGDLTKRFQWTVQEAKKQNPNIKLIASQFWGGNIKTWGNDLSYLYQTGDKTAIDRYAASVADFMKTWPSIDGYDVDYETTNINTRFPSVINAVRAKLDKRYLLTISPADTRFLKDIVGKIDYVNMQNYGGSSTLTVKSFTDVGFKANKLLYGYNAEQPQTGRPIEDIKDIYQTEGLAGIHVWRLNSNIQKLEGDRQKEVHEFLHD